MMESGMNMFDEDRQGKRSAMDALIYLRSMRVKLLKLVDLIMHSFVPVLIANENIE